MKLSIPPGFLSNGIEFEGQPETWRSEPVGISLDCPGCAALRARLAKAEAFARYVLELWADGEYGDIDGGLVQDEARRHGFQVEVPPGTHADCEGCNDGQDTCWELRLPGVEP